MAEAKGLRRIRESIGATQEDVARRTSLTLGTYRRAERGGAIKYSTALEILAALNGLLTEHGQSPVALEALELTIE